MENSDSNAWVFDSLVGFLHGPVWNVPLQTFIEEKSLRKFQLHSPIICISYITNHKIIEPI